MHALPRLPFLAAIALVAQLAIAQGQTTQVGFGGLRQDTSAPVEVTSDSLTVDQAKGGATFAGNVLVVQGEMRLAAQKVDVTYGTDGQGIAEIHASGGVTLATSLEAAESAEAHYTIANGALVMTGNVLLTQGNTTMAGEKLVADLRAGTGQMEGRVKTTFQPTKSGN